VRARRLLDDLVLTLSIPRASIVLQFSNLHGDYAGGGRRQPDADEFRRELGRA
jgi:hypothetical protein